jgi:hypothetical protein
MLCSKRICDECESKEINKASDKNNKEEDGASEIGGYRDVVTEVLHLANKKFNTGQYSGPNMLYHWICTSGFEAFEEELEIIEAGKVDAIPDDQLPLHSIHEFEYRANKTRFEERLKEGNKHEKRRPERAVQKMAIQRRAAVYRLREYREGNKVPRR